MLVYPIGKYAKTPYYIRSLSIRVYSIEELAYVIIDSALRIDDGFMTDDLILFIGHDLACEELSIKLKEHKAANDLAAFCRAILIYTSFTNKETIEHITSLLKESQLISPGKRFLRKGNYYMQNEHILQAVYEYKRALKEFGNTGDSEEYANCLHNLGCAHARIFEYKTAAKYFMESYEMSMSEDTYNMYLASLRLGSSKDEYLELIKLRDISEDKVKDLEDWIGILLKESSSTPSYQKFKSALEKKSQGGANECYAELMQILGNWKNECRRNLEIESI